MRNTPKAVPTGIIVLGAFGLIIPFVGRLFDFGMGPDPAWVLTESRLLRHVIPGIAVIAGGVLLLVTDATVRRWGGTLAVLGGGVLAAAPLIFGNDSALQFARRFVYHWGPGLTLVVLAGFMLGRLSVRTADQEPVSKQEDAQHRPVTA